MEDKNALVLGVFRCGKLPVNKAFCPNSVPQSADIRPLPRAPATKDPQKRERRRRKVREPPIRIELMTFSLRVRCSTD